MPKSQPPKPHAVEDAQLPLEERELGACRLAFESAGTVKALQDAVLICAEQGRPLPRWLTIGIVRTLDGLPGPAERDVVDYVRYLAVRDGLDLGLTWPGAFQYAEEYLVPTEAVGGVETMKKAYKRVRRGLLKTPERFFVARGDGVDLTFQPTVEHVEAVMLKYSARDDLKTKKHKTQTGAAPFPPSG